MYDIIIVGAGPAGLTAAIYAGRANKKVLVLEALTYGGQIINTNVIDNYPASPGISGVELAQKIYKQAKDLGAEIKFEKVVDIKDGNPKEVVTTKETYKTKTIILATGSDSRKLKLENEDKLLGKGISYCATCDGAFYKNKEVAVVGGGITALKDALYLSDITSRVYLIHRRDTFKTEDSIVEQVKSKPNIEIVYNSNVTKLIADDTLKEIEITDKDNNITNLKVDALFIAIGRIPENGNFAKLINLDNNGYIISDENCHTSVEGIFAAGDGRVKSLRQLVTATADGAIAATEAIRYINKNN